MVRLETFRRRNYYIWCKVTDEVRRRRGTVNTTMYTRGGQAIVRAADVYRTERMRNRVRRVLWLSR